MEINPKFVWSGRPREKESIPQENGSDTSETEKIPRDSHKYSLMGQVVELTCLTVVSVSVKDQKSTNSPSAHSRHLLEMCFVHCLGVNRYRGKLRLSEGGEVIDPCDLWTNSLEGLFPEERSAGRSYFGLK